MKQKKWIYYYAMVIMILCSGALYFIEDKGVRAAAAVFLAMAVTLTIFFFTGMHNDIRMPRRFRIPFAIVTFLIFGFIAVTFTIGGRKSPHQKPLSQQQGFLLT